jgi:hypothetical protein
VVDLIPAAKRDQQFAHAVAVLLHFLLQLPAIAHQLARGLVLWRRHVHHVHAVALAAQPCTQVGDQFDDIEPVGLRAPLVAFDRNARWIDDMALDAARLERATDPERVLASFVADDDAHAGRQRPLQLLLFDHVKHGLQAGGGLGLRDRVHGRPLAPAIVQRDLPLRRSQLE